MHLPLDTVDKLWDMNVTQLSKYWGSLLEGRPVHYWDSPGWIKKQGISKLRGRREGVGLGWGGHTVSLYLSNIRFLLLSPKSNTLQLIFSYISWLVKAESVVTNNLSVHCGPCQAESKVSDMKAFYIKVQFERVPLSVLLDLRSS